MSGFNTLVVAGFAQLLAAAGIGLTWRADGTSYAGGETGLYDTTVPASPDTVVVISAYPLTDDPTLSDSEVGVQIRSRAPGPDVRPARDLDDAAADVLLGNYPLTLPNGLRVTTLVRSSSAPLGQDDRQRWEWVSNWTAGLWRPSTHRT